MSDDRARSISDLPQVDLRGRLIEFAKQCPAFDCVTNTEASTKDIIAEMHQHLKKVLGEEKYQELVSGKEPKMPECIPDDIKEKYIAFAKLCPAFSCVSTTDQSTKSLTEEMHQYLEKIQ